MPPTPRTYTAQSPMPTLPSSPARGRVPPPSTGPESLHVSRVCWRNVSRLWRNSRRCKPVALYGRCAPSLAVSPNGCELRAFSLSSFPIHPPALISKGLLFCVTEDAPSVRRADAGKIVELCAARAFGSRRANYGTSHLQYYVYRTDAFFPS